MNPIDSYVKDVRSHLAVSDADAARIEADLRAHLNESVQAGLSPEESVSRMGPPSEVAAELMAALPPVYAPLGSRFGAIVLDLLIVYGLMALTVVSVVNWLSTTDASLAVGSSQPIFGLALLVFVVNILPLAYFVVLEVLAGKTLGKLLFGLSVRREDGASLNFGSALVRRLPILFTPLFILDGAVALVSERHQRGMDILAKTNVLRSSDANASLGWVSLVAALTAAVFGVVALWQSMMN